MLPTRRSHGFGSVWFWRAGNFARSRLSAGSGRLKGGCGQDWPPSKTKRTHYRIVGDSENPPEDLLGHCSRAVRTTSSGGETRTSATSKPARATHDPAGERSSPFRHPWRPARPCRQACGGRAGPSRYRALFHAPPRQPAVSHHTTRHNNDPLENKRQNPIAKSNLCRRRAILTWSRKGFGLRPNGTLPDGRRCIAS